MEATRFSNVQQELLKLFARNVPDADLLNVRKLLADYFLQRAIDEADAIWDERDYSEDLMEEWRREGRAQPPASREHS